MHTMWIFFDHQNYTEKKVHCNNVDVSTMKIRPNKVRGQDMVLIAQRNYIEKVRGNDVEIRRNLVFDVL